MNSNQVKPTGPIYSIDCQVEEKGRRVASTKKRVCWRFGFSNLEALQQGQSGTDCRGEEHEVVMIWSLTSGKQRVLADGLEVHFATARVSDKFECTWTMKGGHEIKVIAYAAPPLFSQPGFKQFEMLIDGLSYWNFPKVYQLGSRSPAPMVNRVRSNPVDFRRPAVAPSPEYATPQKNVYASSPALPEYDQPPTAVPTRRTQSMPGPEEDSVGTADLLSGMTPVSSSSDLFDVPASYANTAAIHSPTSVVIDEFAPRAPPPPTFQATADKILDYYSPAPKQQPTVQTSWQGYSSPQHTVMTPDTASCSSGYSGSQYYETVEVTDGQQPVVAPITPSMKPLTINQLDITENMTPMEKALKSLVNFDDIGQENQSPEQIRADREKQSKLQNTGAPLPPTQTYRTNASLAEIKAQAPTRQQPNKEVMRAHAFDPRAVQAGMMVVYGQQPQTPPPPPPPYMHTGFGMNAGTSRPVYAG